MSLALLSSPLCMLFCIQILLNNFIINPCNRRHHDFVPFWTFCFSCFKKQEEGPMWIAILLLVLLAALYSAHWYIKDKQSRNIRGTITLFSLLLTLPGPFVFPVVLNGVQALLGHLTGEDRMNMFKRFFDSYSTPKVRSQTVFTVHQCSLQFSNQLGFCTCLQPPSCGPFTRRTLSISP